MNINYTSIKMNKDHCCKSQIFSIFDSSFLKDFTKNEGNKSKDCFLNKYVREKQLISMWHDNFNLPLTDLRMLGFHKKLTTSFLPAFNMVDKK